MTKQNKLQSPIRIWLRFVLRMVFFAVALMWPAGTWYWWEAWVLIGLWSFFEFTMIFSLLRHDPELLAERMKLVPIQKEQKAWDKVLMVLFFIASIALYIIPGFDVVRYEWSEPLPLWVRVIAMLVHVPCFMILGWIMRENTFLSQVVKIDEARGHKVITTGPYAWVRHPMYTVAIILLFAVPLALGSRYALVISLFLTLLLIVRTYFEDRALYHELSGYKDYVKKTAYRLIPGLW